MKRKGVIAILDALLAYTLMFVFAATIVLLLSSQDYEAGRRTLVLNYWAEDIAESLARSWVGYGVYPDGRIYVYDGLRDYVLFNPDMDGYTHNETYVGYRCFTPSYINRTFFN